MSKPRDASRSADGVSKPEGFEMDAPIPEDLGVEKISPLWDVFDRFPYRIGFFVPADTPQYFEEDGVAYKTEPYVRNDIDTGIN